MHRFFQPHIEALANQTDANPFSEEPWKITGERSQTANAAAPIEMETSGLLAFAKPGKRCDRDTIFAAHEKIASDLARKLELPVPPVFLSRPPAEQGFPPIVAISYKALPQGRRWSERAGLLTDAQIIGLRPTASAMRVFYTWIVDQDHGGNDGNLVVDVLPGTPPQPALAFIDHSYSLSYGWQIGQPQPMQPAPIFHDSFNPIDQDAARQTIERIIGLGEAAIRSIVDRVSDEAMPAALRGALAQFLCERRALLGQILNVL